MVVGEVTKALSILRSKVSDHCHSIIPYKEVIIVAVSKLQSVVDMKEAYDIGQRHFGENYVL